MAAQAAGPASSSSSSETRPAKASPPPPPPEEGRRPPHLGRETEARARQSALWARARSLCRRLRALQARQVERHVRQQLAGLVRGAEGPPNPATPEAGPLPPLPPRRPGCHPHGEDVLGSELRQLAASATARLHAAQRALDSDATDSASVSSSASWSSSSSSGSSSDGEGPEAPPRLVDARQRLAERQWAVERAAIICRWTWLQAQVSDLEYRIRQQTDVYKQLRANKGPVVLDDLQCGDKMKQQGHSAAVMNCSKNKVLPPSSSLLKLPTGDKQCNLPPFVPSYLRQNAEKQNYHLAQSFRNLVCQNLSCTPLNGSPEPPKACTSSHQVNGINNCFNASSASNSRDGVNADRLLKKAMRLNNNSLPAVAASLDNSCVAARIRPICRYRKRRLVRVSAVSHLSRKPQKPLGLKCNCEQPSSCILCHCKASVQTVDPEVMSLEERVALLDSGFHPMLSFSHGNPLHLHFEALLREDHRLNHTLKAPKAPHNGLKDLTNNMDSSSFPASDSPLKGSARHLQTHKPDSLGQISSLCLENTPVSHSIAPASSALITKKKKVECCYDINNIIIPVSMAAATRVEKLQYKEIITPSWRLVNPKELKTSGERQSELEDTSDEIYLNHHQKLEHLERSHWHSWAGAVPHRRGNRSASLADGRWLPPPPGSPETTLHILNHIPQASSPTGSLSSEQLPSVLKPLLFKGRRRRGLSFSEDTCFSISDTDDDIQNVQPWEPRTFPLSDTEYQALQGPREVLGEQRSAVQPWDSESNQGLRTNHMNSGTSYPTEPFVCSWQAEPGSGSSSSSSSKQQEKLVGQPCIVPVLFNNR